MKLTPEKLTAFCAALAETCNVGKACKAVSIARQTAYEWRAEIPEFAEAWDRAMKVGVSALEDEAHRRGFEGVDKPLTHQGQFTYLYREAKDENGEPIISELTGTPQMEPVLDEHGNHKIAAVKEYSDTLAIFLLKAHAPEKYRERTQLDVSNSDGSLVDDTARSARVAQLLALAAQRKGEQEEFGDLA